MRLHLAAVYSNNMELGVGSMWGRMTPVQRMHRSQVRYILESYHYWNKPKQVETLRACGERIFLDSGAFSAFTKNVVIDLPQYCDFIRANSDVIEVASVLDVVGDPAGTYHNQNLMEQHGVRPLPCFHYGEDERYLEYYISRYEYITLGGMVPITTPQLYKWLDHIWEKYLTDGSGRARLKVHGFGLTTISLMERYPWYSVDSSSWLSYANNGMVFHPDIGAIEIGSGRISRKMDGRHYTNISDAERAALWFKFTELGYNAQQLVESYLARRAFCMNGFNELNKRIDSVGKTFQNEQITLF